MGRAINGMAFVAQAAIDQRPMLHQGRCGLVLLLASNHSLADRIISRYVTNRAQIWRDKLLIFNVLFLAPGLFLVPGLFWPPGLFLALGVGLTASNTFDQGDKRAARIQATLLTSPHDLERLCPHYAHGHRWPWTISPGDSVG